MANTVNPIKRNESLRNLSRDHHFGLLFCWKVRNFLNKVETKRITAYADYFYKLHLLPHFRQEEKHVFPLLGEETNLVVEALDDHRCLRLLFDDPNKTTESMALIAKILERHIRFEERVLFKEIQRLVSEAELISVLGEIDKPEEDQWEDKFWEIKH
ncbi:MAG: hemerythrin domain-containing protein [Bacteroidia bacterium]|nr:hemerythrin domain-containing protein [Bacteroidia bacterium]